MYKTFNGHFLVEYIFELDKCSTFVTEYIHFFVGQISRNSLKDVDRERTPFFYIEVEANDTVFTNTTEVFITVLDVNDNSPIFRLTSFNDVLIENNGTDEENIYNNTCIVWFNASDLDEGPNAMLTYNLTNDFESKFKIDSSTVSYFKHYVCDFFQLYTLFEAKFN